MTETTARFGWPLLAPGQAQKEMTHNEALSLADLTLAPLVDGDADAPPNSPALGHAWIVGSHPTGVWVGHAGAIAAWTAGGWRFVNPLQGMTATRRDDGAVLLFDGMAWHDPAIVAEATGGDVIDMEARATLAALIEALTARGLIAGSAN